MPKMSRSASTCHARSPATSWSSGFFPWCASAAKAAAYAVMDAPFGPSGVTDACQAADAAIFGGLTDRTSRGGGTEASSRSRSMACPSAYRSATSKAARAHSSSSRCETRRQHAHANSRSFHSLARPVSSRRARITCGETDSSHSRSVIAQSFPRTRSNAQQPRTCEPGPRRWSSISRSWHPASCRASASSGIRSNERAS